MGGKSNLVSSIDTAIGGYRAVPFRRWPAGRGDTGAPTVSGRNESSAAPCVSPRRVAVASSCPSGANSQHENAFVADAFRG